jgi:hypothetical protein
LIESDGEAKDEKFPWESHRMLEKDQRVTERETTGRGDFRHRTQVPIPPVEDRGAQPTTQEGPPEALETTYAVARWREIDDPICAEKRQEVGAPEKGTGAGKPSPCPSYGGSISYAESLPATGPRSYVPTSGGSVSSSCAALLDIEPRLRRIKGFRALPLLRQALLARVQGEKAPRVIQAA